jgi:hypothetical protein
VHFTPEDYEPSFGSPVLGAKCEFATSNTRVMFAAPLAGSQ